MSYAGCSFLLCATWCAILIAAGSVLLSCRAATPAEVPSVPADTSNPITTDPDIQQSLYWEPIEQGEILKNEACEGSKILRVSGGDKPDVYGAVVRNLKPKPNAYYRLSAYTRSTQSFPTTAVPVIMVFLYKDTACKELAGTIKVRIPLGTDWTQTSQKMLIPRGNGQRANPVSGSPGRSFRARITLTLPKSLSARLPAIRMVVSP